MTRKELFKLPKLEEGKIVNEEIAYELMKISDEIISMAKFNRLYKISDYEDIWDIAKIIYQKWSENFDSLSYEQKGYIQSYAPIVLCDWINEFTIDCESTCCNKCSEACFCTSQCEHECLNCDLNKESKEV